MKSIKFLIFTLATFLFTANVFATNPCLNFTVDVNVIGNTTLCTGDSVILQANAGSIFNWNNGETTQSIVVKEAGNFNVVVENEISCIAISPVINISVLDQFQAEIIINGDSIICPGESVILTSNISDSNVWNTGSFSQAIITDTSGIYTLTVADDFNCEIDIDTVELFAQTATKPQLYTFDPTIFCEGVSVNLFVDVPSTYNFTWNTGSLDTFINVNYSDNFYIIANDPATGCTVYSDTIEVEVGTPIIPEISFSGDSIMCEGDSIILTSTESFSYFWTDGQTQQTIVVKDTGGLFTVTTNDFFGCQTTSETFNIVYESNLESPKIFGDSLISAGSVFEYFVNAPDNYTIEWTATGGIVDISSNDTISVLWDEIDNSKQVCVSIWSEQGCTSNSNCLSIKIATDLNYFSDSDILLYPNPANNFVKIDLPENIKIKNATIYNCEGSIIKSFSNSDIFDLTEVKSGMYFIKFESKEGIFYKTLQVLK